MSVFAAGIGLAGSHYAWRTDGLKWRHRLKPGGPPSVDIPPPSTLAKPDPPPKTPAHVTEDNPPAPTEDVPNRYPVTRGVSTGSTEAAECVDARDPEKRCWCDSSKKYKDCHMQHDADLQTKINTKAEAAEAAAGGAGGFPAPAKSKRAFTTLPGHYSIEELMRTPFAKTPFAEALVGHRPATRHAVSTWFFGPEKTAKEEETLRQRLKRRPEAPPELIEAAAAALADPDWTAKIADLAGGHPQAVRAWERHLLSLRRLYAYTEEASTRRTIRQEMDRLLAAACAEKQQASEKDTLSRAAKFLAWVFPKVFGGEIKAMGWSDIVMGQAVAKIRSLKCEVRKHYVKHTQLRAIHLIDREAAITRAEERAQAARDALGVLRGNDMKLSEDLVASCELLKPFESVTGFQVVAFTPEGDVGGGGGGDDGGGDDSGGGGDDGSGVSGGGGGGGGDDDICYLTFEGNGRRDALKRAFSDTGEIVMVEVREFIFPNDEVRAQVAQMVAETRKWKHVPSDQ